MRSLLLLALPVCLACLSTSHADDFDDPMRPADLHGHTTASDKATLQLDGIIVGPTACVALMGSRLVHAGDRFADVQIDRITADAVYYHRAGRALSLQLTKVAPAIRSDPLTAKDRP
jgi:hypothetical protein